MITLWCLAGCGSDKPGEGPTDDAATQDDAGSFDAFPTATEVSGVLDGVTFRLTYAAVVWGDSLDTVCVANVPIQGDDCTIYDGEPKTIFVGRIINDQDAPRWAFPVELRRFGASPTAEISGQGSLSLSSRDSTAGILHAGFAVTFDSGETSGAVRIGD